MANCSPTSCSARNSRITRSMPPCERRDAPASKRFNMPSWKIPAKSPSIRESGLNRKPHLEGRAMKIITDEHCTDYSQPGHPERPERISRTLQKLREQTELPIQWGEPAQFEPPVLLRAH